jgi:hypothetical protein
MYQDSNGKRIAHVSDLAWIPIAFSIPPESVNLLYRQRNMVMDVQEEAREVASIANLVAMNKLKGAGEDSITGDMAVDAVVFGQEVIDFLAQSNPNLGEIAKDRFINGLTLTPDNYLASHLTKLFTTLSSKDAIAEIKKFGALHPTQAELADMLVEILEQKED